MVVTAVGALVAGVVSASAPSNCGDEICGRGEDVATCPRDCRPPTVVPGSETVVGRGPNIRAVAIRGDVMVGMTSGGGGKVSLKTGMLTQGPASGFTVAERHAEGDGKLGNASPFVFPDGRRLLLAFRDHGSVPARERGGRRALLDRQRKKRGLYRLRVAFSEDGGARWHQGEADDGLIEQAETGLWEPFLFLDAAGDLRVVYAKERDNTGCGGARGLGQDIVMRHSPDGGHTWRDPVVVASDGISRDGVPSVTRLGDGSYLMVFESWRRGDCGNADRALVVRAMQSRDGVRWEKRQLVYAPAQAAAGGRRGDRASWPFVTTLPDGRAAVTFTSDEGHPRRDLPGEKERNFDIWLLLSKGAPSFDGLEWDAASRTRVFEFQPAGDRINRFPSAVMAGQNELLVFSGLPERFRRVHIGR